MAKYHLGTRVDIDVIERIGELRKAMSTKDFKANESFVTRMLIEIGLPLLEAERGVTPPVDPPKRERKSRKEEAT